MPTLLAPQTLRACLSTTASTSTSVITRRTLPNTAKRSPVAAPLPLTRHPASCLPRQKHVARGMATNNAQKRSSLVKQSTVKEWKDLTTPQKVIATTKVTANIGIIVVGLGILSALTYFIFSELGGSQSSTAIFSNVLERARSNPELQDLIGTPMKGHGEPSRNRMQRNRRVSYQIVNDKEGKEHFLMRFYVEGPLGEGTGFLEMLKDEKGKWEYKYIFVDVPGQGLPSKRVFLIYNANAGKKEDIVIPQA
ncbi:TIM21-domain-containing protein [Endogone sp. FLAS-F59071]|nr:TIM21-domain-containing protein [Endogone sp. FLAS-F59071]|eukprot:RUS16701.1 TIM21-domain-containing protein [Endogone sp. FLAS-F59071]